MYIYVYGSVYMSEIISVRVDDDIKKEIEKMGYTPSEFVKAVILKEIKRERSKMALEWLKKNRIKGGKRPVEDNIREDRDR